MAKYHVSPTTGRPNVCRADKQACPIGGEHYGSKEEAREAIEREAAEAFDELQTPMSKNGLKTPESLLSTLSEKDQADVAEARARLRREKEATSKQFKNVFKNDRILTREHARQDLAGSISEFAQSYQPGCGGCDGSGYDMCRCTVIEATPGTIEASELALTFVASYAGRTYGESKAAAAERREVLTQVAAMLEDHELTDPYIYEILATSDYYGDVIDGVLMDEAGQRRFGDFHQELLSKFGDDVVAR